MPCSELHAANSCSSLFRTAFFYSSLRFVCRYYAKVRPDATKKKKKAPAARARGRRRGTFLPLLFFLPGSEVHAGYCSSEHCLASPVPRCSASSCASKSLLMFRASFEPNANLRSATARADSLPDAAKPRFHRAAAAAVAAVAVVVGKKVSEARFICQAESPSALAI